MHADLDLLLVSSAPEDSEVVYVKPGQTRKLCGRAWDWVEALGH